MRRSIVVLVVLVCASLGAFGQEPVDLGAVAVGATVNPTYTFRNTGLFSCLLQAIGFGADFVATSGPFSVIPPELPVEFPQGGAISWTILFAPTRMGAASATMSIQLRCGIFTQTVNVQLTGQGVLSVDDTVFTPFVAPETDSEGCPCAMAIGAVEADVANLDTDLAAISLYLQMHLGPSVQALTGAVAALEECCDSTDGELLPGPFPSEGGAKFQRFLAAHRNLTLQAALVLPSIRPEHEGLQELLDDGSDVVTAMIPELDQIASITAGLPRADQDRLDSYVPQAAIDFLETTYTVIADPLMHPKLRGVLGSTGQSVAGTILDKVCSWAGNMFGGALGILLNDLRDLTSSAEGTLAIAGLLFQYELERKLDGIIYGLFGITIPPNATESELEDLLRRITSDSLVNRLARLEAGLAGTAERLGDIENDIEAVDERVRQIERIVRENQSELETLEKKICCFVLSMKDYTQQMGAALYGDQGAFRFLVPDVCSTVTVSECVSGIYAMPGEPTLDAIKPEIRALEADMIVVREQLEEILRRLGGGAPALLDEEPPTINGPPVERPELTIEEQEFFWLAITKKIYVYAEDTFTATSASDEHEVHIVTPAFDVSGWVDLSELRPGDAVEIEIRVNVDGTERHFMTTTFTGDYDARLIYFDELTGGRSFIVGDDVKILFRQTMSADNFDTMIPVGYQFVVESQL